MSQNPVGQGVYHFHPFLTKKNIRKKSVHVLYLAICKYSIFNVHAFLMLLNILIVIWMI